MVEMKLFEKLHEEKTSKRLENYWKDIRFFLVLALILLIISTIFVLFKKDTVELGIICDVMSLMAVVYLAILTSVAINFMAVLKEIINYINI